MTTPNPPAPESATPESASPESASPESVAPGAAAKSSRKARPKSGGKAPRRPLAVKRPKAARRPYRGLEQAVLQARLDALQKREESLRARHKRAETTLERLRAEDAARAEAVTA